jgi:hypothetical protein
MRLTEFNEIFAFDGLKSTTADRVRVGIAEAASNCDENRNCVSIPYGYCALARQSSIRGRG